jgi:hypothetical protein
VIANVMPDSQAVVDWPPGDWAATYTSQFPAMRVFSRDQSDSLAGAFAAMGSAGRGPAADADDDAPRELPR